MNMTGNPFYVHPMNDITPGLSGLSSVLSQMGEEKKKREEEEAAKVAEETARAEIAQAFRSGDPNEIQMVAVKYPQVSDAIYKGMEITRQDQKDRLVADLRSLVTAPPEQQQGILERRIQDIEDRGGDATQSRRELEMFMKDPERARKGFMTAFAGVDPNGYQALRESEKGADAPSGYRWKKDGTLEAIPGGPADKPEGADEYQSGVGKLIADQRRVVEQFGAESPQAKAINEAIMGESKGEPPSLTDIAGIRKEFTGLSKDFITIRDAYKKVQRTNPDAAGDLALVFNFMKILDPGSAVREGEQATAKNAAGVGEQVRNTYNRLMAGESLTPEQRVRFKNQAVEAFDSQKESQLQLESSFRKLSERQGLDPENVVVDFVGDLRETKPKTDAPDDGWTTLPSGVRIRQVQ